MLDNFYYRINPINGQLVKSSDNWIRFIFEPQFGQTYNPPSGFTPWDDPIMQPKESDYLVWDIETINEELKEEESKMITYTKKTRNRLLQLANFLEFSPEVKDHFNMTFFLRGDGSYPNPDGINRFDINNCGSTACALGWCAIQNPKIAKRYGEWDDFCAAYFDYEDQNLDKDTNNLYNDIFVNDILIQTWTTPNEVARAIREWVYENCQDAE